jgi:PAS domain-containing protein
MERAEQLTRTDRIADRLARLGRFQWLLVAIPVVLIVVASILMGQRVVHTGDAYRAAQDEKQELSELRNDIWEIFADYWRGYAIGGRPQIPSQLTARYLTASAGLSAIMTNRRNAPGEGPLIARVETVLTALTATLTSDTSSFVRGSTSERAFRAEGERNVAALEDATTDWFGAIDRSIERQERHSDTMISRAFTLLGVLVAAIVGIVFGLWLLIDRARRMAITRMTEERDATRLVMASVQDGLAVVDEDGVVSDVNDRMTRLLGRTRDEVIGRPPPWSAFLTPDWVGETELSGTSLAPDRVLYLSASPMAGGRGSVHVMRDITERTRREEEMRNAAAEQESLRRIATFVAGDAEPARVFEMVAREIALMVNADAGVVTRFDEANQRSIDAGVWLRSDPLLVEAPSRFPLDGLSPVAVVHRTGAPARVDDVSTIDSTTARVFADHGIRSGAAAMGGRRRLQRRAGWSRTRHRGPAGTVRRAG